MTETQKRWIDSATYAELLSKWRFAPIGDSMFKGDTGEYYAARMAELRNANPTGHVQASKSIGWRT